MTLISRLFFATLAALAGPASVLAIEIQQVETPGGISAWLVEEHSIPFTAIEIRFRGGTSLDAPGKRGATYLMMGLIEEGAGDLDARSYARELEDLAASVSYDASDDQVSISSRFLSENRDDVVALLKTTLDQPRFDQDAVDRVRQQVISGLMSDAQDPSSVAGDVFMQLTHGDHPYGSDGKGTVESVSGLTRDDIVAAYQGAIARDRMYVAAVGDITPDQLSELLDKLLGDLPVAGAAMPDKAPVTITGGVRVVDFATPQSVAVFGHAGIERDDPDFFAAYVLNHILGGAGFQSRLMQEVREKRGLTYGIGSYLVSKDLASLYLGSVASGNERMAETISVVTAQWAQLARDGVTDAELLAAKTYLTGAYPLRFDGNGPIAGILVGMQMQDLGIDYIVTRNDQVNAVTLADINRVAAELLQPDNLQFVVVGRPDGVIDTLTAD
jgi:zinc protease